MRVGLDATPLIGARTGVGWYTYELVSALAAAHPDDELMLFPISWRTAALIEEPDAANITVTRRFAPARPLWLSWRLWPYPPVERFLECDVFHATNFVGPPSRRIPTVSTVHDLGFVRHPEAVDADVLAMARLLPRVLRRAAATITVSQFSATELLDWMPELAGRVHVVYNGPHARPAPDAAALPAELRPDEQFVLFLGKLGRRKNVELLLDAFRVLRDRGCDARLVLAGPPDDSVDMRAALAARRFDDADVVLTGYVDDAAVSALLTYASVFAFPSRYEGFGMPMIEAMAAGTPVVAARSAASLEVAADAALLVDPADAGEMADAIESVLRDGAVAERLVAAGHIRCRAFSWSKAAAATRLVYAGVAHG
jgi:glycosyltransferase involved in cell wall biosynthesis